MFTSITECNVKFPNSNKAQISARSTGTKKQKEKIFTRKKFVNILLKNKIIPIIIYGCVSCYGIILLEMDIQYKGFDCYCLDILIQFSISDK